MVKNEDKKILILSMEGGGIKGLLHAEFLTCLEDATKQSAQEIFDFFSGVSIGGINAFLIAMDQQYRSGKLLELYGDKTIKRIFRKGIFSWLNPDGIFHPKYNRTEKAAVFAEIFKKQQIKDAQKPVMVSAYDYTNGEAVYFSTYNKTKTILEASVASVADATSAAPIFFPPVSMKLSKDAYFLDGGLISTNISVSALIEVLKNGYSLNNVKILSLGVGPKAVLPLAKAKQSEKWGALKWVTKGKIVDFFFEAPADSIVHQSEKILEKNFMHVPFNDAPEASLDDISKKTRDSLKSAAKREFEKISQQVLKFVSKD